MSDFKLTHVSVFNPPEEVHERFEALMHLFGWIKHADMC